MYCWSQTGIRDEAVTICPWLIPTIRSEDEQWQWAILEFITHFRNRLAVATSTVINTLPWQQPIIVKWRSPLRKLQGIQFCLSHELLVNINISLQIVYHSDNRFSDTMWLYTNFALTMKANLNNFLITILMPGLTCQNCLENAARNADGTHLQTSLSKLCEAAWDYQVQTHSSSVTFDRTPTWSHLDPQNHLCSLIFWPVNKTHTQNQDNAAGRCFKSNVWTMIQKSCTQKALSPLGFALWLGINFVSW